MIITTKKKIIEEAEDIVRSLSSVEKLEFELLSYYVSGGKKRGVDSTILPLDSVRSSDPLEKWDRKCLVHISPEGFYFETRVSSPGEKLESSYQNQIIITEGIEIMIRHMGQYRSRMSHKKQELGYLKYGRRKRNGEDITECLADLLGTTFLTEVFKHPGRHFYPENPMGMRVCTPECNKILVYRALENAKYEKK